MGNVSSMLTSHEIEEVQQHCNYKFSHQQIVSFYQQFCALDRNRKGFITEDELVSSVPEFGVNPICQTLMGRMLNGLNFKDFVLVLSILRSGSSLFAEEQSQQVMEKAGYYSENSVWKIEDFVRINGTSGVKMDVGIAGN
ncbi:hypothetical protein SUGI_1099430 [Cryptomeria japonica]|uniref:uncharacterized protein LOC131076839 n=1 Tax=Cryptomeria japonica TaxID=3369 RepID=UPI0024149217|nr:uncharacterized protein LOC131076839 [Cryptomeria japonica]GLJ51734.1 hypothetical protein SUGI_1099430 [Cryptomeria japonica]